MKEDWFSSLESLRLRNTRISGASILKLAAVCRRLTYIDVVACPKVSEQDATYFKKQYYTVVLRK
jgi:hypothetical protein